MKQGIQKINFFVASFLGVMGLSLASEIFMEDDFVDKIDDILFLLLGGFAVYWYTKNAEKKGMMPVILVALGTVIKFLAIIIEMKDKEAVGDDIGVFVAFLIALILVIIQVRKLKKAA